MVAKADVFIQNLAPGAAASASAWGRRRLTSQYPRLIYCSVSGYGEDGSLSRSQSLRSADSGRERITGDQRHARGIGAGRDFRMRHCGGRDGSMARFCARSTRVSAAGKGRALEVSLFHTLADWMNVPYLQARYGGQAAPARRRQTSHHRALWRFSLRGRQAGDPFDPKRARMGAAVRPSARRLGGSGGPIRCFATNNARVANRPALDATGRRRLWGGGRVAGGDGAT